MAEVEAGRDQEGAEQERDRHTEQAPPEPVAGWRNREERAGAHDADDAARVEERVEEGGDGPSAIRLELAVV